MNKTYWILPIIGLLLLVGCVEDDIEKEDSLSEYFVWLKEYTYNKQCLYNYSPENTTYWKYWGTEEDSRGSYVEYKQKINHTFMEEHENELENCGSYSDLLCDNKYCVVYDSIYFVGYKTYGDCVNSENFIEECWEDIEVSNKDYVLVK